MFGHLEGLHVVVGALNMLSHITASDHLFILEIDVHVCVIHAFARLALGTCM